MLVTHFVGRKPNERGANALGPSRPTILVPPADPVECKRDRVALALTEKAAAVMPPDPMRDAPQGQQEARSQQQPRLRSCGHSFGLERGNELRPVTLASPVFGFHHGAVLLSQPATQFAESLAGFLPGSWWS